MIRLTSFLFFAIIRRSKNVIVRVNDNDVLLIFWYVVATMLW